MIASIGNTSKRSWRHYDGGTEVSFSWGGDAVDVAAECHACGLKWQAAIRDDGTVDFDTVREMHTCTQKRPSWDAYFLEFARVASLRATCDRKHVGAVIVVGSVSYPVFDGKKATKGGQIAATGYNGSVRGAPHCSGEGGVGHDMVEGHCVRTIHAEMNCLAQAARRGVAVDGASIYTTASPCWDCFRVLANAGIVRFVYAENYRGEEHRGRIEAAAKVLGIEVMQLGGAA